MIASPRRPGARESITPHALHTIGHPRYREPRESRGKLEGSAMDGTLTAVVFMAAGAGMSVLREVPSRASTLFADLFSISIAVDENDPVHWFATWLARQTYGARCRRLKLWVKWRNLGDFGQESTVSMVELEPGRGPHLFRYRGRWFLLTREEHQPREHFAGR